MNAETLPVAHHQALHAQPRGTFVSLIKQEGRVQRVGILNPDDDHFVLKPTMLIGSMPELTTPAGMLRLTPLFFQEFNVGWLADLPALPVTVGRNYVKVVRRSTPQIINSVPETVFSPKHILVLDVSDVMTLLLSRVVKDMRT